jgi:hypothetical protein
MLVDLGYILEGNDVGCLIQRSTLHTHKCKVNNSKCIKHECKQNTE